MIINVYPVRGGTKPVRERKPVRNYAEAQSFCRWYERTYGEKVNFVICRS